MLSTNGDFNRALAWFLGHKIRLHRIRTVVSRTVAGNASVMHNCSCGDRRELIVPPPKTVS